MDSACATLLHSNVNKVSPNRTILAGEKVGIAWLLPKQPGVDWYGFLFPAFLWLWLLQVWACLCCSWCYAKASFVKSTWLQRPCSQSCALAPAVNVLHSPREIHWGSAAVPQTHPRASGGRSRAVVVSREQLCCCPPAKPVRNDLQAATATTKSAVSSLDWFHSSLVWTLMLLNPSVNSNVTL